MSYIIKSSDLTLNPSNPQRYEFLTYTFFANQFGVAGFDFTQPIRSSNNTNFNYDSTDNSITDNISYFYVDILDISTNQLYEGLTFNDVASMQTFVTNKSITSGRITLYAYQNDTSNLRLGGVNEFSTMCTLSGKVGKISSEASFHTFNGSRFRINFNSTGVSALKGYLTGSFITDLTANVSNPS